MFFYVVEDQVVCMSYIHINSMINCTYFFEKYRMKEREKSQYVCSRIKTETLLRELTSFASARAYVQHVLFAPSASQAAPLSQ